MNDKKSILLVHPLGENWVPGERDMSRIANIMPPLGLCSLAAWVEQHGHRAAIHDCYAFPMQDQRLVDQVRSTRPDYLGITATTSSFLDGVRIARMAKEVHPAIKVVFGGAHLSAMGERALVDFPVIDYGVLGEGEETLLALMESGGEGLAAIPGLLYREHGAVVSTGFRKKAELIDLDTLPFPAYHKLAGFPGAYKLPIFNYPKAPATTVVSSRGCPYQCTYCDRTVFQRSYRFNSPEYMFAQVEHLHREYGVRHINFYDDLFTLHKERVVAFCERMIRSGLHVSFNCAARAEHVDLELLRLMKRAGCWMMSLGIETGDPELLQRHRSNSDVEMIRATVETIRQAGIRTKGLFIVGLPGESEASLDKSIAYALDLPLDDLNVAKFTPFMGSPAYATVRDFGNFDERWELMNCTNFVFIPDGFTKERLEERYREFYRRFFERPHVLLGYVKMLWGSPNSWVRFIADLGAFLGVRHAYSAPSRRHRAIAGEAAPALGSQPPAGKA